MKYWNEKSKITLIRMILLTINIILTFVVRENYFVLGYIYGVNLVIILESLVSIWVTNHNRKWMLKPFKDFEKEMKKAFKKLDDLYNSKEEK